MTIYPKRINIQILQYALPLFCASLCINNDVDLDRLWMGALTALIPRFLPAKIALIFSASAFMGGIFLRDGFFLFYGFIAAQAYNSKILISEKNRSFFTLVQRIEALGLLVAQCINIHFYMKIFISAALMVNGFLAESPCCESADPYESMKLMFTDEDVKEEYDMAADGDEKRLKEVCNMRFETFEDGNTDESRDISEAKEKKREKKKDNEPKRITNVLMERLDGRKRGIFETAVSTKKDTMLLSHEFRAFVNGDFKNKNEWHFGFFYLCILLSRKKLETLALLCLSLQLFWWMNVLVMVMMLFNMPWEIFLPLCRMETDGSVAFRFFSGYLFYVIFREIKV
ncbi:hypothetical protein ENBRE01_2727 [Enteropsectra breve]|nr:hypothetical protein ENBRE01_2727 [Enteropsectra breve]